MFGFAFSFFRWGRTNDAPSPPSETPPAILTESGEPIVAESGDPILPE